MKLKNKFKILIIISFFLFQCSPTLNYIGNSYSPTNEVLIFFDADEIQEKHTIMGLLTFNVDAVYYEDNNEVTNLMINKAKEVGADAVLVTKFSSKIQQMLTEELMSKKVVSNDSEKLFVEAKFLKFEK